MRGGELGFMGRGQLVPEFAAVAFNLNDPNKVSKIVETHLAGSHLEVFGQRRAHLLHPRAVTHIGGVILTKSHG